VESRWDFIYTCEGFRFERVHTYKALIPGDKAKNLLGHPRAYDALIKFAPDDVPWDDRKSETGKLSITLPGDHNITEDPAKTLAVVVVQQVNFTSGGDLMLEGGLVTGEHLPETDEEEKALGEMRYFMRASIVEADEAQRFDGSKLAALDPDPLIGQYLAARRAKNPIDQYLGFFRVLEAVYGGGRQPILQALSQSADLLRIAQENIPGVSDQASWDGLAKKLKDLRNECAHLSKTRGGLTPGDPRIDRELMPLLPVINILAKLSITGGQIP
jgi:hypothetical protein